MKDGFSEHTLADSGARLDNDKFSYHLDQGASRKHINGPDYLELPGDNSFGQQLPTIHVGEAHQSRCSTPYPRHSRKSLREDLGIAIEMLKPCTGKIIFPSP